MAGNTVKDMTRNFGKLDKFEGHDFRRWQKKMHFLLTTGHILNGVSDSLFDVYMNVESSKELWDSLESKYMAEDSSGKKFLIQKFGHVNKIKNIILNSQVTSAREVEAYPADPVISDQDPAISGQDSALSG
ncbi:hypothetical protein Tco_1491334 [Tanacetum coccineum]